MYKSTLLATLFSICSILWAECPAQQKTVVFDLGDTLIVTDEYAAFREVGLLKFITYLAKNPMLCAKIKVISRTIEERYFAILNAIEPRHDDEAVTHSAHGFLLPQLMCSWMKGTRSGADTYELVMHALAAHPEYCTSKAESNLIVAMARLTFTPEIFASTRKLAPHALELVHYCKQEGYRIAILSNWDPESFSLVYDRFPELFSLVDEIVISGNTGFLKPDPRAYEALLQKDASLPAETYTFIDDRPENIEAAQKAGMQGIVCPIANKKPDLLYVQQHIHNTPNARAPYALACTIS